MNRPYLSPFYKEEERAKGGEDLLCVFCSPSPSLPLPPLFPLPLLSLPHFCSPLLCSLCCCCWIFFLIGLEDVLLEWLRKLSLLKEGSWSCVFTVGFCMLLYLGRWPELNLNVQFVILFTRSLLILAHTLVTGLYLMFCYLEKHLVGHHRPVRKLSSSELMSRIQKGQYNGTHKLMEQFQVLKI